MDSGPSSSAPEEYYDDIYFDSSGSEEEGGGADGIKKVGKKVRKMTDDELFYDPKMDEEDEKWMKRQRMNYLNGQYDYYNMEITGYKCLLKHWVKIKPTELSHTCTCSTKEEKHSV